MNTIYDKVDRVVQVATSEEFANVTDTDELVAIFQSTLHMLVDDDEGQRSRIETIFRARLAEARCPNPVTFLDKPIKSEEQNYIEREMQFAACEAEYLV